MPRARSTAVPPHKKTTTTTTTTTLPPRRHDHRRHRHRHRRDSDGDTLHTSDDDDDRATAATTATHTTTAAAATAALAPPPPLATRTTMTSAAGRIAGGRDTTAAYAGKKTTRLPHFVYMHGRTVYGGNPIVQQTLPGYFAYASPFIMVPLLFVLMVPFVVIGASIMVKSASKYMVSLPYSDIHRYQYVPDDPAVNVNDGVSAFVVDGVTHRQGTVTWVWFNVTQHMRAPVYMYYTIDNMYQNHRAFHAGRSAAQLRGKPRRSGARNCAPYERPGFVDGRGDDVLVNYTTVTSASSGVVNVSRRASSFIYYPCGVAPWAMFNDTFVLYRVAADNGSGVNNSSNSSSNSDSSSSSASVSPPPRLVLVCNGTDFDAQGAPLHGSATPNLCSKASISWPADRLKRYAALATGELWWSRRFPYRTSNAYLNAGWYLDEPGHALPDPQDLDLQVWLRSAVTPSFRKLYRVLDTALQPGTYALRVTEYYDVVSFRGRKGVVLRRKSWVSDSDTPLGVLFAGMGCLCFVLGVSFVIEYALQRCGNYTRCTRLPLPRRRWFDFDPDGVEFARYYQLRMRRHRVTAELRRAQTDVTGDGGDAATTTARDCYDDADNDDDVVLPLAADDGGLVADDAHAMAQQRGGGRRPVAATSDLSSL